MRDTRLIMGMPISVEIPGGAPGDLLESVFAYFNAVDRKFSLYKADSEISAHNRGEIAESQLSAEMLEVFAIANRTGAESNGYFEMRRPDGKLDPSGIVKGWAVLNAAGIIRKANVPDYYINAGGDIQMGGKNQDGENWRIGIRNPFNEDEIVKALAMTGRGIATSGNYVRGQHIYNPHRPKSEISDIVSLTVIGPDVLEADRFATAAFAMGEDGIYFIEEQPGLEGYIINAKGIATETSGFGAYVIS
jgi:thiamine biosynthesis lipoprotein